MRSQFVEGRRRWLVCCLSGLPCIHRALQALIGWWGAGGLSVGPCVERAEEGCLSFAPRPLALLESAAVLRRGGCSACHAVSAGGQAGACSGPLGVQVSAHPCAPHPGPVAQSGWGFCARLWGCEGTVANADGNGHESCAFLRFALKAGGCFSCPVGLAGSP